MQQSQDTVPIDSTIIQEEFKALYNDSSIQAIELDTLKEFKDTSSSAVQKPRLSKKTVQKQNYLALEPIKKDSLLLLKDSLYKDSINNVIATFREKLEIGYTLNVKREAYMEGEPKDNSINNWSFFVLLFCLLLLAMSKAKYSKRFNLLLKSIQSWKFAKQIIRYEKVYSHPTNITLLLIFVFSTSLFIQSALLSPEFASNEIQLFFLLCFILIVGYLIKIFTLIIVGKIFNIQVITEEYIFHTLLFFKFTGIILLPISIVYIFSDTGTTISYWLGVFIIVLSYLIRVVRRVLIGLQANESLYSIILYLCTLEILPVLVIGKFFNDLLIN